MVDISSIKSSGGLSLLQSNRHGGQGCRRAQWVAYGRILGALLHQLDSVIACGDGGEANFLEMEVVLAASLSPV